MSEGLTLAKLIAVKKLLDEQDVPSEDRLAIPAMFFGPPSRRRHRHPRKPIARWREKLARMEHKAQRRRRRNRTEVRNHYDAIRHSLKAGEVTTFMGFKIVASGRAG